MLKMPLSALKDVSILGSSCSLSVISVCTFLDGMQKRPLKGNFALSSVNPLLSWTVS